MKKLLSIVAVLLFVSPLLAQTVLNPSAPSNLSIGNVPVFSPPGGSYGVGQTVTINNCGSQSIMYTLDGEPPTIASIMYTGPISVTSTETITAICATVGAYQTSTQNSATGTNCFTAAGGTWGSTTCASSGGVIGSPTNVTFTIPGGGAPAFESLTTPTTSSSQTQALFVFQYGGSLDPSAPRCDTCTEEAQDITFAPTAGSSIILENEFDNPQFDDTHSLNRQHGYQCNQQSGTQKIQVDSGHSSTPGGWTTTTVPCNFAANVKQHIVTHNHWIIGDTGCYGGNGCDYYDFIGLNSVYTTLNGDYGGSQGFATQSGEKAWGRQDQIGLASTSGTAITGGRNVYSATVALGVYGSESTAVGANYVISPATPVLGPFTVTQMLSNNAKFAQTTQTTGVFLGCAGTNPCLPFQTQVIHTASPAIPFVVANCVNADISSCASSGSSALTVSSMAITGTNASDFTLTGTTTGAIASGSYLSPSITFTPTATAGTTETATLTVNYSGATVTSQTMSLSGISLASATSLSACSPSTSLVSNTHYVLTSNVSATGSCFLLNAQNVDFNANGHTITFCSAGGTANVGGFYVTGYNEYNLNFHGGSIVEASGKTCTGLNTASYPQGSSDFMVSSDGSSSSGFGNKFINATLVSNDAPGHNIYEAYSGGTTAQYTVLYNVNLVMNGTFNCSSGNVGCRAGNQFYAVDDDSPQNATAGGIFENIGQVGGTQGGIAPPAPASIVENNVLQTGSSVATNSNGFTVQAWSNNVVVENNLTNGSGIGGSCLSCRGIQVAAVGTSATVTGVTVENNVERVAYLANNNEYGGCALGGSYGAQINKPQTGGDVSNNLFENNKFIGTAGVCIGIGFSDSGSTTGSGINKSINDVLGCNIDPSTYLTGTDCNGVRLDALQYSPAPDYAIEWDSDTIYGDTADVFILGTPARNFKQDTFGVGAHPVAGQLFVDFNHGLNSGCNATDAGGPLYFIDPTFTGGVTAGSNNLATWATNNNVCTFAYYVDWTYTVTVEKASTSAPISGASVSIVDTTSTNQCTTTTNSSGVATCVLKAQGYQAATGTYSTPSFNPMAITITASGCTTGVYSESITATTGETKKLSGC